MIFLLPTLLLAAAPVPADHAAKMAKGTALFQSHVRGVLIQHCFQCHGGETTEAELDLSDRDHLLKGGFGGPAVVPGDHKKSRLWQLVSHTKKPRMPEDADKLPNAVIARIAEWIDLGAPYDKPLVERKEDRTAWIRKTVPTEARQHWAFQPLRPVTPPAHKPGWGVTPIDAFVRGPIESAGLPLPPEAEPAVLLRRIHFDLVGLPPTPAEQDRFLADPSPKAYAERVDALLASPHYGERWGRHWLDLARFAESHGFEHDYDRPTAYVYRDFVIKALNADMPFDQFVKWQLAGDEYAPDDPLALAATGFLAAGVHSTQITKNEVEKHRYDELDDMLATIGTSMLGLTIGCARCHDHKYDAIPQADYYRLLATFTTTVRAEVDLADDLPAFRQRKAAYDAAHAPLTTALAAYEKTLAAKLTEWEKTADVSKAPDAIKATLAKPTAKRTKAEADALAKWFKEQDAVWQLLSKAVAEHARLDEPKAPRGLISTEGLQAVRLHSQGGDFLPETHFLRRGDTAQKDAVAEPGFLQVLLPSPDAAQRWRVQPPQGVRTSYRRRALAEWLCDVEHGAGRLLARVIVNRLWQHHLGRGLVATPSDFGTRGDQPSHPELLDWLAQELIRHDWRLKPIHKLIMTSAVYRQANVLTRPAAEQTRMLQLDPENRLCARRPARRLEAEVIRDAVLAASDRLDTRSFGPGTLDEASRRRSVYFTVKRSRLIPMMVVFDAPDGSVGIGERPSTTIAPQALWLMNNAQVRSAAEALARAVRSSEGDAATAIETAYRRTLARRPSPEERQEALDFLEKQQASYGTTAAPAERAERALADFCHLLFCMNEFVYVH